MAQSFEYLDLAADQYDNEQHVRLIAEQIVEILTKRDGNEACAISALLANELLDITFTDEEELLISQYLIQGDGDILAPISARAIEHMLPGGIDNYPSSKRRMINNFSAVNLRPLTHFAISMIDELGVCNNYDVRAIEKIVQLELNCTELLRNRLAGYKLDELTEQELERNRDELSALARVARREGLDLDVIGLMQIQPRIFEMITSNDPVTTVDVNYRKKLNSMPGAARSLQAPEHPDPDKLLSRYGDYMDFIEATAATKRGGYASTFGFLHRVSADEKGNPFIVEYPHTMFDSEILAIEHPVIDKLKSFEQDFHRTHDMLHNALPVYADHFMIHHPTAPITLGGYLPEYATFGKSMRRDKSSYELGLAILHRQVMQERFSEDPSLLTEHVATIHQILEGLQDLQVRNICSNEIIDHVSFVVMSAAMNILPFDTKESKELLDLYDQLDLPTITVSPSDVYKLLIQQEVVMIDSVLEEGVDMSSKDKAISQVCRRVDNTLAVDCLAQPRIDYANGEQGAEYIVKAVREIGIEPIGMDKEYVLGGQSRLRWIGITASSRRLKGFNEKIHGLETVRFWDADTEAFLEVSPVTLLGKFYDHFQQHEKEYNSRVWLRGFSNATLRQFKNIIFDQSFNRSMDARNFPLAFNVIDKCVNALIDDDYIVLGEDDVDSVTHLAEYLKYNGYQDDADRLTKCLEAYEILSDEAGRIAEQNGKTFVHARKNITEGLMSLDG